MNRTTLNIVSMGVGAIAGIVAGKCIIKYIKSKPVEQQNEVARKIEKTIMIAGGAAIVALMNRRMDIIENNCELNTIMTVINCQEITKEDKIDILTKLKVKFISKAVIKQAEGAIKAYMEEA